MRGRRLEKTGSVSLEYVEDFFGPRTTQTAADRLFVILRYIVAPPMPADREQSLSICMIRVRRRCCLIGRSNYNS
jgi:hypothetical protein